MKVLWRGLEAFEAALGLVQAAEDAARQGEGLSLDFTWRDGILRPAPSQKQVTTIVALASVKLQLLLRGR